MQKRVGHVTREGRYVIIEVPEDWLTGDPLPPASVDDRWFETFLAFMAALNQPYDRTPIDRQPWNAPVSAVANDSMTEGLQER
jgi:hypothetical protein